MNLCFTAKPGSAHFSFDAPTPKGDATRKPQRRQIYFTAVMVDPARIKLATGQTFTLAHAAETTPVWVSIWQEDASDPHTDVVDGSPSFIHVSPREKETRYAEDHITINIVLGTAQFEEILRAFRDRLQITFITYMRFVQRESTDEEGPKIITFDEPGWRAEGDSIKWRNDLKRAVAIESLTINITMPSPEPSHLPVDADTKETSETTIVDDLELPVRRFDIEAATRHIDQSLATLLASFTAAHRALSLKISWIVALVALAIITMFFRR